MSVNDLDVFDYEYDSDTATVEINTLGSIYGASIEDYPEVMSRVVNILQEVPDAENVVLSESRDYEYSEDQIMLLREIANAIQDISAEGYLSQNPNQKCDQFYSEQLPEVQQIVVDNLRRDPVGAYVEIKRKKRHLKQEQQNAYEQKQRCIKYFFQDVLDPIIDLLEETTIIKRAYDSNYITGHHVGDREVYREFFHPLVRPNFMLTKYMSLPPERGEEIDRYTVRGSIEVSIYEVPDKVQPVYHIDAPEFKLPEEKYKILDAGRRFMASHEPESGEFARPKRMRQVFENIGRDMLRDISNQMDIPMSREELENLTEILNRYTSGLGVLELLLSDPKIQDVYVNSPIGDSPIFIAHEEYEECETNLIPTREEAESWATRFRIKSGRPLDEANPVLDTEAEVPGGRARVAIIQENLSPEGLAFAFRRHRSKAWTLPLFIDNGMINPLGAALISFIVDGNRSVLFSGTRGAGKCVKGDTKIQLSNGEITEIKDLVGKQKREIDDGTVHKPSKKLDTVSLQNDRTLDNSAITDVWKRESPEKLIRIRTDSGREIFTTPEHPYFTYYNGFKQLRADELNKDDRIATPRNFDTDSEKQKIELTDKDSIVEETEDNYILRSETSSHTIEFPKIVTDELAELVGLVVGDGHVNEKSLEFTNESEKVIDRFVELLEQFEVPHRTFDSSGTDCLQVTCRVLNRTLNDVFEIPLGEKSSKVKIPQIILRSPNNILKSFIRGYFAADGYVAKDKKEIELATASRDMKEQLRMALLRYGITVYTKEKQIGNETYYRVFIRGRFVDRFTEKIGIAHPKKQQRLNDLSESQTIENTNIDVVPGGNELIKELRDNLRMTPTQFRESGKDYWAYENNQYNVSRRWFEKIFNHFEERWSGLKELEDRVELLREFTQEDSMEYLQKMEEVRSLLNMSYSVLAEDTDISERGVRNMLQENSTGTDTLENSESFIKKMDKRVKDLETFNPDIDSVENTSEFVEKEITTYAELSENTDIPTTSLKSYVYGGVEPPKERKETLIKHLDVLETEFTEAVIEANKNLSELSKMPTKTAQIMAALNKLRDELNISNEEFSGDLHYQTVSSIFSGRYEPSIDTLQSMAKQAVKIYDETMGQETESLMDQMRERASSDIFWDKIDVIEKVEPQEDMVYDLTVGETHNFVANGVIAHNSSLLGASMLEIMKKHRIVSVEDSVTADTSIIYRKNDEVRYGEIGDLIDDQIDNYSYENGYYGREVLKENPESVKVLSMSDTGTLRWSDVSLFMRHDAEKPVYEVETRTGRKIKVTEDHSLFTMGEKGKISEVKPTELDEASYVVTPRKLKVPEEQKKWNLLEKAEDLQGYFVGVDITDERDSLKELAEKNDYSEHTVQYWIKENIIPAKILAELEKEFDPEKLSYKHKRQSFSLPAQIKLDQRMMEFLGLWMADGCYDNRTVIVTVSDEKCRAVVKEIFERFNLPVKHHSDEHSLMANSQVLKEVMKVHGFEGDAHTKRVPEWVFSAKQDQRTSLLKGLYSGDGYSTEHEAGIDLINEELIEDIQTLLLIEGIRGRARDSGKMRSMRISDLEGLKQFKQKIGYIQDYKNENLDLDGKTSTHDTSDIVPLPKKMLQEFCKKPNVVGHDYKERGNQVGRQKLKQVSEDTDDLEIYAESDIFWDQVKSVEKVSEQETVYDISVPGDENFVAGNILAHNTLELPINQMKDLGYNVERMKSRSVITQVENELSADEAIRTSLRLGDSALVIGEVRSDEAQALYEAMRVGAVANFVGGTIHGESAYSVFDRVVNDLGVPRTSFKATDIIVSVNKIRSPDGMDTYRRVTGITEVRKDWKEDPSEENGFVDLMRYDSNEDELVPTDTLLNGESIILNRIAENIREWKNNWDAVWDNIQLRKDMKKELVDRANETGDKDLLEADFTVNANQKFHKLSKRVGEEYGGQNAERIYARWEEWLDRQTEVKNR